MKFKPINMRIWERPILTAKERAYLEEGFEEFKGQRQALDKLTRVDPDEESAEEQTEESLLESPIERERRAHFVDVPHVSVGPGEELPRCKRLHTDGRRCASVAAVDGQCLRHWRWHQLYNHMHGLPLPEDALSLQEMLAYTADLVLSRRITPEEGQAVAAIGRVMLKNLVGCDMEMRAIEKRRG